jgi:hypothetical protein
MSNISITGNPSGTGIFTIQSPNSNVNRVLTLPDNTGTILSSSSSLAGLTGVGKVLQVHYFSYSPGTTFSTSSTSFTDLTGASTTFTPTQSGGFLIVQAVVPIGCFAPSGGDVHSYSALYDSSTKLEQTAFQGDNLGKLGDTIWLPCVATHNVKVVHGSTSTKTFKIRVANSISSQQVRLTTENTVTIMVWEIAA